MTMLVSNLIQEGLFPCGAEMNLLPKKEQDFWIKRAFSNSYAIQDSYKLAKAFNRKWFHRYNAEQLREWGFTVIEAKNDNDTPQD
jgi:hypothetical protein